MLIAKTSFSATMFARSLDILFLIYDIPVSIEFQILRLFAVVYGIES